MFLTCNLCGSQGGTDTQTCKYTNHITYKKKYGTHVVLPIIKNNESKTINEYNK